jgi:feruloyl esterase
MKTGTWLSWTSGLALALAASGAAQAADCAGLKAKSSPTTEITAATLHPGGAFAMPAGTPRSQTLPSFCRVQGVLRPTPDSQIAFEVWLPAQGWNGRFQGVGNGGFAGAVGYGDLANAVKAGYAAASTDTGHVGGGDAKWAKDHPEKLIDFGWRAVHLTAVTGKDLTQAFYGQAPRKAYFTSCSNGGRQALMEAQRFPEDYDGIIAGAPAYNWTHLFTGFIWNARALALPGARIPAAKAPAIEAAALKVCDAKDGAVDGLISDPLNCHFDAKALKCAGAETDACLTEAQIAALNAIRTGPRTSKGRVIYYGFPPGGENTAAWPLWIFGAGSGFSAQNMFGSNFAKYMVGAPESWTPADFNFDNDLSPATYAALDAVNPDLSTFEARGGKLILFHGWSDPAIPAQGTIAYRDQVAARMGAKRADGFTRLFLAPGVGHCGGGAGPSDFDQNGVPSPGRDATNSLAAALETWVEQGRAPEQLIALTPSTPAAPAGPSARTGLLCAYPKRAALTRGADPMRAQSYSCKS